MNNEQFRRCDHVMLLPRERRGLDMATLLAQGQARLAAEMEWIALVAHRDEEIPLDGDMLMALMALVPSEWHTRESLEHRYSVGVVQRLIDAGLLTAVPSRNDHWHGLAALAHRHLRWRGIDAKRAQAQWFEADADDGRLLARLGPAPPATKAHDPDRRRVPLPAVPISELTALAERRITCRNFHPDRSLDLPLLAAVLQRTYGARAECDISGIAVLKKTVPSAGGLHPIEAYLLIGHVQDLSPGLYHYDPVGHALTLLKALSADETREHARAFVARQDWFVDAAVMVVLAARFRRNFWKYRRHAKSYRAVILDAGHLSQMQYLVATELGLGAFITAAINEGDIEDAFGLDPMEEGVLAVTGFGYRGDAMGELEFDPLGKVWPDP